MLALSVLSNRRPRLKPLVSLDDNASLVPLALNTDPHNLPSPYHGCTISCNHRDAGIIHPAFLRTTLRSDLGQALLLLASGHDTAVRGFGRHVTTSGSDLTNFHVSDRRVALIQQSSLACLLAQECWPQQAHTSLPGKTDVCMSPHISLGKGKA